MASTGTFEHLNDDVVADFAGMGSQKLIEKLQTQDLSRVEADELASEIFTELLICHDEGQLTNEAIVTFLTSAINDDEKAIIFCQALDIFPTSETLQGLIGDLKQSAVIQPKTFAENVDTSLLSELEFVPGQLLNRQLNTRKRDIFYTQKKFNLLYEEFEGYAKLVQEVFKILKSKQNLGRVDLAIRATESLIGHYLLDPNRVLDVLLEIFSHLIVGNQEFIIRFLKRSRWWPATPATPLSGIPGLNYGGCETASKSLALKFTKANPAKDFSETFKILVAILIKNGFISFGSIYKYLRPGEEEMQSLEALYKKELDEKVFKSNASALALAAPLASEEDDADDKKTTEKKNTINSANETLSARLSTNAKFQFLKIFLTNGLYWPSLYIIAEYPFFVHVDPEVPELMLRMLEKIIEPLHNKAKSFDSSLTDALSKPKLSASSHHMGGVKYVKVSSAQLYCFKPTAQVQSSKDLVYFYSEWVDDLPQVKDVDGLFQISQEMLKFLGTELSRSIPVFCALCEILTYCCKQESGPESTELFLNYFRNYILPALGSVEENPVPAAKAFEFLSLLSPDDRFNLYGELYQVAAKNNLHIKINYGRAEKATKDTLKRLSKENVTPMMRRLAKISYTNPLPCFLTILQQIESYDNLNSLVVETAQYFNEYGWDNLTLAILMRLTSLGRSNIQQDGLHERQWIQSLASFIGQICHKYPGSIDLKTIVLYLVKSFHLKESSGLLVFKEMLAVTGGIKPINNLTPLQIDMINSGQTLERIVYRTIDDRRFDSVEAGRKLANVFLELDVINEVLALLTNLNRVIVSGDEFTHLKVLANRNDDINTVLHFFCTLVGFFGEDDIPGNLESITTLVDKYGVSIPWAFELWRPYLTDTEVLGDIGEKYTKGVSSTLFTTFWSLKLFDINYNEAIYDSEATKLQVNASGLRENLLLARKDRDTTQETLKRFRADIVRLEDDKSKIPAEKDAHKTHEDEVTESLSQSCSEWFSSSSLDEVETEIKAFLQECVFPRCIHSSFDAVFSARFLFKLHEIGQNQFSIITLLVQLFQSKIVFPTLFTCTPSEAECLGLFYAEILKKLAFWYTEDEFKKLAEVRPLKGYKSSDDLSFKEFRKLLFDFHSSLLADVSRSLAAEEYMCRRNAITLMKNLLGIYPNVEDHCEAITELISKISATEEREDLKLSSSALIGHVKSRSKTWVHMWDFYEMPEAEKEEQMQKRKVIEEEAERKREEIRKQKEAEEKRLREEEQKRRREEEEEASRKMEEEKAEQQRQASAKALSYDDEGAAPARQARGEEVSRGRYDQYSRASPRPSTPSGQSGKVKDEEKGVSEDKKPESTKADQADKAVAEKENGDSEDLFQDKTSKGKRADQSSRQPSGKPSPAESSDKTPKETPPVQENAKTRFANQKISSEPRPAPRRALPPQQPPRNSRYGGGSHQRRDDRSGRHSSSHGHSRGSHANDLRSQSTTPLPPPATPPPPPPPPPSTAPPKRDGSDRGDRKREWRGSYNRQDKRSRR
ncbi:hypothetical protein FT663_01863 [Candidozyma haemuli var. vulneris]|nr:hypothetical protein FT663_01863 [[Candida] haemuloni var. vulneris]KAF3993892.1 hypothetical protein FT662_00340 [[Candida] haemuloni var. vulneris]